MQQCGGVFGATSLSIFLHELLHSACFILAAMMVSVVEIATAVVVLRFVRNNSYDAAGVVYSV